MTSFMRKLKAVIKVISLKKRKIKHTPIWYLFTTIIVIIVFYTFFSFSKGMYKIWRLSRIKHTEERALKSAIEEKERLESEIERLKTDSLYIEEIAREEYGMIKKGEEVFHITLPDTATEGENNER